MNRRQLLSLPLLAAVPLPLLTSPSPKRVGKVIVFRDGHWAAGRLTKTEREHWEEQLKMARLDPDYTIITDHHVTCYDAALKDRIVSVPGASDDELRAVRDQIDRQKAERAISARRVFDVRDPVQRAEYVHYANQKGASLPGSFLEDVYRLYEGEPTRVAVYGVDVLVPRTMAEIVWRYRERSGIPLGPSGWVRPNA